MEKVCIKLLQLKDMLIFFNEHYQVFRGVIDATSSRENIQDINIEKPGKFNASWLCLLSYRSRAM